MYRFRRYRIVRLHGTSVYRIEVEKPCFFGSGKKWVPFRETTIWYDYSTTTTLIEYPSLLAAAKRVEELERKDYEEKMRSWDRWEEVRS
jgi:hypothetical protein